MFEVKKFSVLSVITLRLMRTKKTHTGAVKTGFPRGVGDHHPADVGGRRMFEYLVSGGLLGVLLL